MESMFSCFESRKGALLASLTENRKPAAALAAVQDTFDTVLYKYINECGDDRLRSEAAYMVNTAKTCFPLIECVSETKIWVSKSNDEDKAKKNISVGFTIFMILAMLSFGVLIAFAMPAFAGVERDSLLMCGSIIAFAAVMTFLAGMFLSRKPKHKDTNDYKADIFINAEDVIRRLTAVMLLIDKNLDAIKAEEDEEPLVGDDKTFDPKMLDMYASLLEGKYSANGEYALEQLDEVAHYLHSQGITLIDYAEDTAADFEFLPSAEGSRTLVPAMIYNGRLIRHGLATKA